MKNEELILRCREKLASAADPLYELLLIEFIKAKAVITTTREDLNKAIKIIESIEELNYKL